MKRGRRAERWRRDGRGWWLRRWKGTQHRDENWEREQEQGAPGRFASASASGIDRSRMHAASRDRHQTDTRVDTPAQDSQKRRSVLHHLSHHRSSPPLLASSTVSPLVSLSLCSLYCCRARLSNSLRSRLYPPAPPHHRMLTTATSLQLATR